VGVPVQVSGAVRAEAEAAIAGLTIDSPNKSPPSPIRQESFRVGTLNLISFPLFSSMLARYNIWHWRALKTSIPLRDAEMGGW